MQPIVVSGVQVPFADYRRLYFSLTYRSLLRQAAFFVLPVLIIFGLIMAFANVKYLATPWFYGPPVVLVLALLVAGAVLYLNRIRAVYDASSLASTALDYTFDPKRFTVASVAAAPQEVRWEAVAEARRQGPWLLLLTAAPATHLVDLRRVQAPATEADLLALLGTKGVKMAAPAQS